MYWATAEARFCGSPDGPVRPPFIHSHLEFVGRTTQLFPYLHTVGQYSRSAYALNPYDVERNMPSIDVHGLEGFQGAHRPRATRGLDPDIMPLLASIARLSKAANFRGEPDLILKHGIPFHTTSVFDEHTMGRVDRRRTLASRRLVSAAVARDTAEPNCGLSRVGLLVGPPRTFLSPPAAGRGDVTRSTQRVGGWRSVPPIQASHTAITPSLTNPPYPFTMRRTTTRQNHGSSNATQGTGLRNHDTLAASNIAVSAYRRLGQRLAEKPPCLNAGLET